MRMELYKRIFLNFALVISLSGILGGILGAVMINRTTVNEAQRRISLDLRSGWNVIENELDKLRLVLTVLGGDPQVLSAFSPPESKSMTASLESVRRKCGFDFLSLTDNQGRVLIRTMQPYIRGDYLPNDPFVAQALKGQLTAGFAILDADRLKNEGHDLEERAFMVFEPTPKAKIRAKNSESAGMVIMASAPVADLNGKPLGVIYAGVLLNRNHNLVDKIRSIIFEDQTYNGVQIGNVTIFQWDARIATNVMLANGQRAIGTRVSQTVYDNVLENALPWYDRAFVVNDWYVSAYDPIFDVENRVIGILYVGILAKTYDDIKYSLWKANAALSIGVALAVFAVSLIFARRLTGSLTRLAETAGKIAEGHLNLKVPEPPGNDEVRDLTRAFNLMTVSLKDREDRLNTANTALEQTNCSLQRLNANYLDMLGFVSHELKNTLGVIYTSARALEIQIGGTLSVQQADLVHNISRNVHAAVNMARKYLDLARIESAELRINRQSMDLIQDVIRPVIQEMTPILAKKGMLLHTDFPPTLPILADPSLLKTVFGNLFDNAVKYGAEPGEVRIQISYNDAEVSGEVWNLGEGLPIDQLEKIFEKFVRFDPRGDASRGSGLGLFITREIIAKHGGRIWAESEPGVWMRFCFRLPGSN
ncbi:MAG: cache domain-containing protein [Deltaproteobacteria bacterium]